MTTKRILTAAVTAIAVTFGGMTVAAAHDTTVESGDACDGVASVTVTAWDGIVDGVYAGDDSREVSFDVYVDGILGGSFDLAAPDFTKTFTVPALDTVVEIRMTSTWGDGASAADDSKTITVAESGCVTPTTMAPTTTTTEASTTTMATPSVPVCASDPDNTGEPCPHDVPNPSGCTIAPATPGVPCPYDYEVPVMPAPTPVVATPAFTG